MSDQNEAHPSSVGGPESSGDTPSLRVRPYTVTGGRTKAEVDLGIETMIRTITVEPTGSAMISESRAILDLCGTPQSIAEISAHLALPLQVVKVLAGDLVISGNVSTHAGTTRSDGRPDLLLLERVLDGLQRL